eukprot:COSAG06_NODE_24706_length_654_cov_0.543165_1_plen_52_part_10
MRRSEHDRNDGGAVNFITAGGKKTVFWVVPLHFTKTGSGRRDTDREYSTKER